MSSSSLPDLSDSAAGSGLSDDALSWGERWKNPRLAAPLVLALLAPALGGAVTPWTRSLLQIGIGLVALLFPGLRKPSRIGAGLAALFLLAAGASLVLPASLFHLPWRDALLRAGFDLPWCVSPQPWITFREWMTVLSGLVWFGWICGQEWSARDRRWLAGNLALGIAALALASLVARHFGYIPPGWNTMIRFGPFPNRNQTATLFATGAVLVFVWGWQWMGRLRRQGAAERYLAGAAALWLGILVVCITALAADYSRAGPIFFIACSLAWLGLGAMGRRRRLRLLVGALCLILGAAAVFLFAGPDLVARYTAQSLHDFRLGLYRDTLDLVKGCPWTGAGLGSFEPIFPFYWHAGGLQIRILHPESDWLWLAAETGLPGVLAVLCLFGWAATGMRGAMDSSGDGRLRLGLLLCAAAFACHAMVDVPAHRLGTIMPVLLIFGLALAPPGSRKILVSKWPDRLRQAAAFVVLVMGLVSAGAIAFRVPLALADGPERLAAIGEAGTNAGHETAARAALDRALLWTPLNWRLLALRALGEARTGRVIEALRDFRQARVLEPNDEDLPRAEGMAWMQTLPRLAMEPWAETLRRAPATDRGGLYADVLAQAYGHAELRDALWGLAVGDTTLELIYLGFASNPDAVARIDLIVKGNLDLSSWAADSQRQFIALWMSKGDSTALIELLQTHPALMKNGWRSLADHDAAQGDFLAASRLCLAYLPPPAPPSGAILAEPDAARRFQVDPSDAAAALALYRTEMAANQPAEALAVLQKICGARNCPVFFYYLEGELLDRSGRSQEAWQALSEYMSASR